MSYDIQFLLSQLVYDTPDDLKSFDKLLGTMQRVETAWMSPWCSRASLKRGLLAQPNIGSRLHEFDVVCDQIAPPPVDYMEITRSIVNNA